jgi:(p)ppGpp synthase/HD superfamily hydrolase
MKYELMAFHPFTGERVTIVMSEFVHKAYQFAKNAHKDQKRKYTFEPYINHPVEVMQIVSTVPHTEEMLAAALLHDVVEDCGVQLQEIFDTFSPNVCYMVNDLSDVSSPEDGNRATRKAKDRNWIAGAKARSKTIKLADLISNSRSIVKYDKDFARVYIKEKELLLEVLTEGDATLYAQAKQIVEEAKKQLGLE